MDRGPGRKATPVDWISGQSSMLLFKRKFQAAITSGQKTQTIRLWRRRRVRVGDVHFAPGVGYLRLVEVGEVALEDLTEEDARADGFESLAALRAELRDLYGEGTQGGRRCFRIAFEYLGRDRPA
jgi:hypothetical protein